MFGEKQEQEEAYAKHKTLPLPLTQDKFNHKLLLLVQLLLFQIHSSNNNDYMIVV